MRGKERREGGGEKGIIQCLLYRECIFCWQGHFAHPNFNQAPKPYPGSICVLPCKIQFYQECSYVSITRSESVSHSVVSDSLWPHELYSPRGSSLHGIFQARILEWVAIPFYRGSSQPSDRTQVSHIAGRFRTVWATREAPNPLPFSDEHAAAPNCSKLEIPVLGQRAGNTSSEYQENWVSPSLIMRINIQFPTTAPSKRSDISQHLCLS